MRGVNFTYHLFEGACWSPDEGCPVCTWELCSGEGSKEEAASEPVNAPTSNRITRLCRVPRHTEDEDEQAVV